MKKMFLILSLLVFSLKSEPMENSSLSQLLISVEKQEDATYHQKFYYVPTVSRKLAEAYCQKLNTFQYGFARAWSYCNHFENDKNKLEAVKPFLTRFSTEVISRAFLLRSPHLQENEVGDEFCQAIDAIEADSSLLSYILTGKKDGLSSKEKLHEHWHEIQQLRLEHKRTAIAQKG